MIQVQQDRFMKNSRKEGPNEQYPRYEQCKANFARDFAVLNDFLADNHLPQPSITQCEVTYVNHIVAGEGWISFADADNMFSFTSVRLEVE